MRIFAWTIIVFVAASAACDRAPSSPSSTSLAVGLRRVGNAVDADSIVVDVAGSSRRAQTGDTVVFTNLAPGSYAISLSDVAPNCFAPETSATAVVTAGERTIVGMAVECYGGIAYTVQLGDTLTSKLYYLGEDGTTREVSSLPGVNFVQGWSPDGSYILFARRLNDNWDLYTVRPDGSELRLMAGDPYQDLTPDWSPDGTRIVFHRRQNWGGMNYRGWLVMKGASGGAEQILLDTLNMDFDPAWSPDGSTILFSCNRFTGAIALCATQPDGSGAHLVFSGNNPQAGRWAADGRHVAFRTIVPVQEIMVANPDGTGAISLLPGSDAWAFRWAPDGAKLLVDTWEGGDVYRLYVTDLTGARLATIPLNERTGWFDWSEDGSKLLVVASDASELYVVNPDGTGAHPIITGGNVVRALWRPGARPGRGAAAMMPRAFVTGSPRRATNPRATRHAGCAVMPLFAPAPVGVPACPR